MTSVAGGLSLSAEESSPLLENSPLVTVDKKFPALELLPPGSVLDNVSLPQYEQHRKTSLITSERMNVVSETEIAGDEVHVLLFGEDGRETTRMFTLNASYFFDTLFLVSDRKTIIEDDRFQAEGTGLRFHSERKIGFLLGPVTTHIRTNQLKKDSQ